MKSNGDELIIYLRYRREIVLKKKTGSDLILSHAGL